MTAPQATDYSVSLPTFLRLFAAGFPAESAALADLPIADATPLLIELLRRIDGVGVDDTLSRMAEHLRAEFELGIENTDLVTGMSVAEQDRWDELCREVLQATSA